MNLEDNILHIDSRVDFDDVEQFKELSSKAEKIVIETNDVHPSIMQLLFCLSKTVKIEVDDEFNKRFFENIRLAS